MISFVGHNPPNVRCMQSAQQRVLVVLWRRHVREGGNVVLAGFCVEDVLRYRQKWLWWKGEFWLCEGVNVLAGYRVEELLRYRQKGYGGRLSCIWGGMVQSSNAQLFRRRCAAFLENI